MVYHKHYKFYVEKQKNIKTFLVINIKSLVNFQSTLPY